MFLTRRTTPPSTPSQPVVLLLLNKKVQQNQPKSYEGGNGENSKGGSKSGCRRHLAKAITNEDIGLNNFGIAKKIQKIMNEQQKNKNTRKQSQMEEEDEGFLAKEHKTQKRHEQPSASILDHPAEEKLVP